MFSFSSNEACRRSSDTELGCLWRPTVLRILVEQHNTSYWRKKQPEEEPSPRIAIRRLRPIRAEDPEQKCHKADACVSSVHCVLRSPRAPRPSASIPTDLLSRWKPCGLSSDGLSPQEPPRSYCNSTCPSTSNRAPSIMARSPFIISEWMLRVSDGFPDPMKDGPNRTPVEACMRGDREAYTELVKLHAGPSPHTLPQPRHPSWL
jgi:hypothetical protein